MSVSSSHTYLTPHRYSVPKTLFHFQTEPYLFLPRSMLKKRLQEWRVASNIAVNALNYSTFGKNKISSLRICSQFWQNILTDPFTILESRDQEDLANFIQCIVRNVKRPKGWKGRSVRFKKCYISNWFQTYASRDRSRSDRLISRLPAFGFLPLRTRAAAATISSISYSPLTDMSRSNLCCFRCCCCCCCCCSNTIWTRTRYQFGPGNTKHSRRTGLREREGEKAITRRHPMWSYPPQAYS